MSGRIVGVNGQVLSAPAEERADVSLDFFFPSSKKDDPRIQVLGHLAQVVIQMSMEAGIEEFCLRFHNSLLSSGLTVQPSGRADIKFIATEDPSYKAFVELELPREDQESEESPQ